MRYSRLNLLVLVLLLAGLVTFALETPTVQAAPNFNDAGFANTWNRVDKPVEERSAGLGRGYTWGPIIAGTESVKSEPYGNGTRVVQYFDKARMEVNNPQGNPNDRYYVTTGLLVKELVTGLRQDGDSKFTPALPSREFVAGDPTANSSPTYAQMRPYVSFTPGENSFADLTGRVVGVLTAQDSAPEERKNVFYDTVTKHNIPDVFMDYARTQGLIWENNNFVNGTVYYDDDMLYVRGRPVSEAYWIRATVGGTVKPVMVQLFERRVLTYTPSNPAGFKVEMGNVGQHYYRWRYGAEPKITLQWELGYNPYRLREQSALAVDSDGNTYIGGVAATGNLAINKYRPDNSLAAQFPLVPCFPNAISSVTQRLLYMPVIKQFYVLQNGGGQSCVQQYNSDFRLLETWSDTEKTVGLALDKTGNLYLADNANRSIRKYNPERQLLMQWGSAGDADGQFQELRDVVVDSVGNIYTLDTKTASVPGPFPPGRTRIQKFDASGKFLLKWGNGSDIEKSYSFFNARQLRVDSSDRIYLNDYIFYRAGLNAAVYQFSGDGTQLAITTDRNLAVIDLVEYGKGSFYILEHPNLRPYVGKLDSGLKPISEWRFNDAENGQFALSSPVAVNTKGEVFAADNSLQRIQKFDAQGNFLTKWENSYVYAMATARQDNLFLATTDPRNTAAKIYKLDASGKQLLTWDIFSRPPNGLPLITHIAPDPTGNLYVLDIVGNRVLKFDGDGKLLLEWTMVRPQALTIDNQGNVYVYENATGEIVRHDPTGKPNLRWRPGGINKTSIATSFESPQLIVDTKNNLIFMDSFSPAIERYSTDGILTGSWDYPTPFPDSAYYVRSLASSSDGGLVMSFQTPSSDVRLAKFRLN